MAITQLAQTRLRSVIGRMELDKTFEERDHINATVVAALDEAARAWGVKVGRYRTLRSDERLAARVVRMTSTEQET